MDRARPHPSQVKRGNDHNTTTTDHRTDRPQHQPQQHFTKALIMATDWAFQNFLYLRSLLYDGIDHSIPGNGGMECYNFLTLNQRLADTVSYLIFLCFGLVPVVWRKMKAPKDSDLLKSRELLPANSWRHGKKILLIVLCLTFGIELGYKLSTKQLLYLLNPCHIITSLQVQFSFHLFFHFHFIKKAALRKR